MLCLVFSPDEKTFACISSVALPTLCICDSETGHLVSGPFELKGRSSFKHDALFSPDGKHILVKYYSDAVVWDIERCEEEFEIEGSDFVFICHGRCHGSIASINSIDEDGSSTQKHSTRIQVKLWDAGNGTPKSSALFEVMDASLTRFSPDGRFLAVGRMSEDVVELWNLEDGKNIQRFPHPPGGDLSSLQFSPTGDTLIAAFREPGQPLMVPFTDHGHIYVWRLDTEEMASLSVDIGYAPPAVIRSPLTSHLFIPQYDTVEIWEVSMTRSHMIFKTKPPIASSIHSICPSRDGNRILVGSEDGIVRMWDTNLEDLTRNQPVTMDTQDDTNLLRVIAFSHSGKMAAIMSKRSFEFWDTTTWKVVGHMDIKYGVEIAFSPDENQVAVLSSSLITILDINNLENRLSFDPWPRGRRARIRKVAFQTSNHVVICAKLQVSDDVSDVLLQVWHVTGRIHFEYTFSWKLKNPRSRSLHIHLAPDGLTVVISDYDTVLCYSWNHDTARFHPFHFTNQEHLSWFSLVHSSDGKLVACHSDRDCFVRVWDTRTGQLCGNPIKIPDVQVIALSPALNDQSLGNRLIAIRYFHSNKISLLDVYTGHVLTQFWSQRCGMEFIHDGTMLITSINPLIIRDIAGLKVKHQNGYELVLHDMKDGWMVGQDNESLFWVPFEHRKNLCPLPQFETILGRSTKLDTSDFRYGNKWTECIDKDWLKELEDKEKKVGKLLECERKM